MQKDYKIIDDIKQLIKEGQIELAYKKLVKLYKLNPGNNYFKFELAKLIFTYYDDKLDKAYKYFKDIYDRNHYLPAKLYIAKIYVKDENYDIAIKTLQDLVESSCGVAALYELGDIYLKLGNKNLSKEYYEKARILNQERVSKTNKNKISKSEIRKLMDSYGDLDNTCRNKINSLKRNVKRRREKYDD